MKQFIALSFLGLILGSARADVKPHALFSDHMVLQRGKPLKVWGKCAEGEQVTVAIQGQIAKAETKGTEWIATLNPLMAGGPLTLIIKGKNTIEINDVLIGEVWIASGQSNMEWPLAASENGSDVAKKAANKRLRLFTVPKRTSPKPESDVASKWLECKPETVTNFSAVGYFFGRDLQKALDVPVGIINSSWGGTPAQAWTTREKLQSNDKLSHYVSNLEKASEQFDNNKTALFDKHKKALEMHKIAVEKAKAEKKTPPRAPAMPTDPRLSPGSASTLYNGMIHPLRHYGISGAIWYQGESNAGSAFEYRTLYPAMITSWREAFAQGNFPFHGVQLAPFMAISKSPQDSAWAELREAQFMATRAIPHVGMAVITDVGDEKDIHPRKKEPVGARLALLALKDPYAKVEVANGPTFKSMKVVGNKAVISFENVGSGLEARGDSLTGFTIASADRKFQNAIATIEGNTVVVELPTGQEPVAVRFGWSNFPVVNLWNKNGLPAVPFRTDSFKGITERE